MSNWARDADPTTFTEQPSADARTQLPIPPPTPPVLPSGPGYENLEELARGGMGVVCKAKQNGFNRVVALKMILSGSHAVSVERERFRVEAEAIARLKHPNIVLVYEVGEHEGKPFFSMEFCPGGGLDKTLNGTPMPPAEAAQLVLKLALAAQEAHEKGVIHRDLKPANVLLTEDGTPKMVDFGLAKRLDAPRRTQTGVIMGTLSCMAKEQAAGKSGEIGLRTDVYSLGAIHCECLTRRPPFKGPTDLHTLTVVLSAEPTPPQQLQRRTQRDLEAVVLRCLEKDRQRRCAPAKDLAEEL
ncbi:MAG TPA: serine/threonine-protein kinase [Gemmataceae bacterium]|nr:serine/threonine-protein kinase [Gemmataceae bacterium]